MSVIWGVFQLSFLGGESAFVIRCKSGKNLTQLGLLDKDSLCHWA
jgi:hypothetical protein